MPDKMKTSLVLLCLAVGLCVASARRSCTCSFDEEEERVEKGRRYYTKVCYDYWEGNKCSKCKIHDYYEENKEKCHLCCGPHDSGESDGDDYYKKRG